jgi:hypothetical protein
LVLLPSLLSPACLGWFHQAERDEGVRQEHAAAVLDGVKGVRTLLLDADTDVVWFEYDLPSDTDAGAALQAVAARIRERDRCFTVAESNKNQVRLRCRDASLGGFREYVVGVLPADRRIAVMYGAIDGPAEESAYPGTVRAFDKQVLGR